ncbi:MAG: hypothetical protein AVDCRST_MAG67-3529, partial [uncultured Solirubrobacteraceae bacterium]
EGQRGRPQGREDRPRVHGEGLHPRRRLGDEEAQAARRAQGRRQRQAAGLL